METKKKISFDIDRKIIDILKSVSSSLKIKQADILRFSIYRFLNDFLKKITILEISNNDIFEKEIDIFKIEKIENFDIPSFLQKSGYQSKGKILLKDGAEIYFFSALFISD